MEIGPKLSELRIARILPRKNWRTGGTVQRIHLPAGADLTSPSIATLVDILQCLGTTINEFFSEDPEEQVVFHYEDYFEKEDTELLNKTEWIIPNAQKNMMEPIRLTLKPGGSTYRDVPHEGEEFGYVLKGTVKIHIGKKVYTAKKGESFYFTPHSEHYIEAPNSTGATIIWSARRPVSKDKNK